MRRPRSPTDTTTLPIVLAHGIARFDHLKNSLLRRVNLYLVEFGLLLDGFHYFKGIGSHLWEHGYSAYPTSVGFAEPLSERGRRLRCEVERVLEDTKRDKVHIIAHSMGGLDARWMIANEGMEGHVASLNTIGTPHNGSAFADWWEERKSWDIVEDLEDVVDLGGFQDLTRDATLDFNREVEAREAKNDVVYRTYASYEFSERVFYPLRRSWRVISEREGKNDGLVSVASQAWTSSLSDGAGGSKSVHQYDFPVRADHLNQLAWWNLNQLHDVKWWQRGLLRKKARYEAKVRDLYVEIADRAHGRR